MTDAPAENLTIDAVFDAAMLDARKRWTTQPWTSVGQMIDEAMSAQIKAFMGSDAFKAKVEALALAGLLEPDALPAMVKKNLFDSTRNRENYFVAVIKSAIEKNSAAIDKLMAELVTTNGEKIVTEMFKSFLTEAASKAAGSFIEALLSATGEQTRLAIQNAQHKTHY